MDFHTCLENICDNVDGVVAATLMGLDGLPIETIETSGATDEDELDIASLLVEYSSVLGQVQRSAQMFDAGDLEEVGIRVRNVKNTSVCVDLRHFLAKPFGCHQLPKTFPGQVDVDAQSHGVLRPQHLERRNKRTAVDAQLF